MKSFSAKISKIGINPSRQKEILRYLNSLKTEEVLDRNIERAIKQLLREKTDGLRRLASRSK